MGVKARQMPNDGENWNVVVTHKGERRARKVKNEPSAEKKAAWVRKRLENLKNAGAFRTGKRKRGPALGDCANAWAEGQVETNLKWDTKRYFLDMLQRIPDEMKARPLAEITRDDVCKLAVGLLEQGLTRLTAAGLLRTISAICISAAEDGVYRGANLAHRPGRILHVNLREHVEETDCMNQEDAKHLFEVVREHFASLHPIKATVLHTAARLGK